MDGIHVHLDPVASILEVVGFADRLAWQLVGLANGHESTSQRDGQRCAEHQSTCFQSSHRMDPVRTIAMREEIDAVSKRVHVQHQRGDVPEQDAGLGEVRDAADAPGNGLLLLLLVHPSQGQCERLQEEKKCAEAARREPPTFRRIFALDSESRMGRKVVQVLPSTCHPEPNRRHP
eukprot:scaffold310_cov335-Pavlova_lutheri.AAC.50